MKRNRRNARNTGILFLTAMVTSLLGGGILESMLGSSDYLLDLGTKTTLLSIAVFLELVNGIAVVGIVALLYPILKQYQGCMSLGFAGFRIVEAMFCFFGAVIPLFLLALSQEYFNAGHEVTAWAQTLGKVLMETRMQMAGLWIPLFFGLGALLFYVLMFTSRLIPRFISIWGLVGVALIWALNLLDIESGIGLGLALPIITNEIFLGIWLIVKGFREAAL